ncbi:MAG: hypothetical protein KKA19_06525, partial [Candidatus Margulisbacteria bacterium]|nr:hypothetical protein [Candidatus Margulisiibacteriota bacterium]
LLTKNPVSSDRKLQVYLDKDGSTRDPVNMISYMEEDMWSYMADTAAVDDEYTTENSPYSFKILNQAKILENRQQFLKLQNCLKIYARLYQEFGKSRDLVHKEMSGYGGYSMSSVVDAEVSTELATAKELFERLITTKQSYVRTYNSYIDTKYEFTKATIDFTGQFTAFLIGIWTINVPIVGGPGFTMTIAKLITDSINIAMNDAYEPFPFYANPDKTDGFAKGEMIYIDDKQKATTDVPEQQTSMWEALTSMDLAALEVGQEGYASSSKVKAFDRREIIKTRNKIVAAANLQKATVMLIQGKVEARSLVHQELTNMSSPGLESEAIDFIDTELNFVLGVLAAVANIVQNFIDGRNKRHRELIQYGRNLGGNTLAAIPYANMGAPMYLASYDLSVPGSDLNLDFSSIWDEESDGQKAGEQGKDYEHYYSIRRFLKQKDTRNYAPDTNNPNEEYREVWGSGDLKLKNLNPWSEKIEMNTNYVVERILQIMGDTAALTAWASVYRAQGDARNVVHQEMTGLSGRSPSGTAKNMVQSDNQIEFQNFEDQLKLAQHMLQFLSWKVAAIEQFLGNMLKGIVGTTLILTALLAVAPFTTPTAASAIYTFFSAIWDISFSIVDIIRGNQEKQRLKQERLSAIADQEAERKYAEQDAAAAEALDTKQKAELKKMMQAIATQGENNWSAIAGTGLEMISKINRIRENLFKVKEKQMQSRANVKVATTGITGASGYGAASAVGALYGQGIEQIAQQVMGKLQRISDRIKEINSKLSSSMISIVRSSISLIQTSMQLFSPTFWKQQRAISMKRKMSRGQRLNKKDQAEFKSEFGWDYSEFVGQAGKFKDKVLPDMQGWYKSLIKNKLEKMVEDYSKGKAEGLEKTKDSVGKEIEKRKKAKEEKEKKAEAAPSEEKVAPPTTKKEIRRARRAARKEARLERREAKTDKKLDKRYKRLEKQAKRAEEAAKTAKPGFFQILFGIEESIYITARKKPNPKDVPKAEQTATEKAEVKTDETKNDASKKAEEKKGEPKSEVDKKNDPETPPGEKTPPAGGPARDEKAGTGTSDPKLEKQNPKDTPAEKDTEGKKPGAAGSPAKPGGTEKPTDKKTEKKDLEETKPKTREERKAAREAKRKLRKEARDE